MRPSYPRATSLSSPRSFKWHSDWTINVQAREAIHASGAVFEFTPGWRGHLAPPLGDKCPSGSWKGTLRGGELSVAQFSRRKAERICREACLRFDEEAWDACQDCSMHTAITDYYMVNDGLWKWAHPNFAGMLCIACLERRIGRALHPADFTTAPINAQNPEVLKILLREQSGYSLADQLLVDKGLVPYMTGHLSHALFLSLIRQDNEGKKSVITDDDCRQALWQMLSYHTDLGDVRAVLIAMRDLKFACTWRVPEDEPFYILTTQPRT